MRGIDPCQRGVLAHFAAMSLLRRYVVPRLRHGARTRGVAGWLAAFALLLATLAPQLQALTRPDAHDPLSSMCAGGSPVSGPAGDHPFGNACALCTLAHTAPALGAGHRAWRWSSTCLRRRRSWPRCAREPSRRGHRVRVRRPRRPEDSRPRPSRARGLPPPRRCLPRGRAHDRPYPHSAAPPAISSHVHSCFRATGPWAAGAFLALAAPQAAYACLACGCTLNADWASQGMLSQPGWSVDLRHDVLDQSDLRSGTGPVNRAAIGYPTDDEIQQKTFNHFTTLTIDDGIDGDWGVTLQLPWFDRFHTTIAEGDTGVSGVGFSQFGDARILARYTGFARAGDWGLQFGLKLPTGKTDVDFQTGPQAGTLLDRGLQPGTGSTDALMGGIRVRHPG